MFKKRTACLFGAFLHGASTLCRAVLAARVVALTLYERLSQLIKKKAVTPRWVTALAQATSAGAQPMNS
jgi:hypothetical protein